MSVIIILTVMSVASCMAETAPLSCDHPIQPEHFTHCSTCFYGSWSDYMVTGLDIRFSSSQCKSGYAYQVERTRQDNDGKCQEELEHQYQCKLQLFIIARDVFDILYVWVNQPQN